MSDNIIKKRRGGMFPVTLHKVAENVTRPAFKQFGVAGARLIQEWHVVVGKALAEKTLPTRMSFAQGKQSGGTLHVTVESGWALEVQHLEPIILEKIATFYGYRAIDRIRIVQAPMPKKNRVLKKELPPLDEAAKAQLTARLAYVSNESVRRALADFGQALLRTQQKA